MKVRGPGPVGSGQPPAPPPPAMFQLGQEDHGNISMHLTLSASSNRDSSELLELPGLPPHGVPSTRMGAMFSYHTCGDLCGRLVLLPCSHNCATVQQNGWALFSHPTEIRTRPMERRQRLQRADSGPRSQRLRVFVLFLPCSCYCREAAAPKCDTQAQPEVSPKPGATSQDPQSEAPSPKPTHEENKGCCKAASPDAVCYAAPRQPKLTVTMPELCLKTSLVTGMHRPDTTALCLQSAALSKKYSEMPRDWLILSLLRRLQWAK